MRWRVCTKRGRWIGIVETNFQWALPYWNKRGFILVKTDYCPVCGAAIYITGETKDRRIIGSCGDAFTIGQWKEKCE